MIFFCSWLWGSPTKDFIPDLHRLVDDLFAATFLDFASFDLI
jgi:hypothetical protein